MPRRRFLTGLVGLIAAPAVIRVADLMPIKAVPRQWTMEEIMEEIRRRAVERIAADYRRALDDMLLYGRGQLIMRTELAEYVSRAAIETEKADLLVG